ncbi:alpha/beta hydrolase [Pararhodobacter sp.]|uniref:alpha/beta hydrolase n=1 Tax=Pararhodobacter sp. TaxID=2127056 RepID=UPI002FE1885C
MAGQAPAPLAECGAPEGGRAVWLRAADGVRLRVGYWPGERLALVLPGRTEVIEKYGLVVRDLAAAGWGALVVDWRGQGLADRALADPLRGHVGDFAEFQRDLDAVLDFAQAQAPGPMPWLAHSMGGCIALRGLTRGLPCKAVAFSAPMLGLAQEPGKLRALGWLAALARPFRADRGYAPTTGAGFGLPSMAFEGNNLTTDPAQFERMKAQILGDPRLSLGGPSLRWMAAALAEITALAALPSPEVPALFGLGGAEGIVSPAAVRDRAARWPGAELAEYPGARHELLMERPEVREDFLTRVSALFSR